MSAPHGRRVAWATTTPSTTPAAQPAGPPSRTTQARTAAPMRARKAPSTSTASVKPRRKTMVSVRVRMAMSHPLHRQLPRNLNPWGCWVALTAQPEVLVGLEDEGVRLYNHRTPVGLRRLPGQLESALAHDAQADRLALGREVGQHEQALAGLTAQQAEDVVVAGPQRLARPPAPGGAGRARGGAARAAPPRPQPAQPVPQSPLDRVGLPAPFGRRPVHRRAV